MTRKILFLVLALPVFAERGRTAYVDLEYVYQNSALKKAIYKEYTQQRDNILTAKKKAEEKISLLSLEKKNLQLLLGFEEAVDLLKQIDKEIEKEEKTIQEARQALRQWESENAALLFDEVMLVLENIANEEKFDLILSKKNAIIYGDPSLDITQKAIDLINEIDERAQPGAK
ncbi:MAG: OmpH family outer membrane protein [Leptospiraceae bacterium]|nr:OmpH family outer membrane protein [Leptospiraceae bacterium]MDW8306501.1 OmpH family outer membrane protein [Leptospiraceae bacterium]